MVIKKYQKLILDLNLKSIIIFSISKTQIATEEKLILNTNLFTNY